MKIPSFLESYPLLPRRWHSYGTRDAKLGRIRDFSSRFGMALHDLLLPDPDHDALRANYGSLGGEFADYVANGACDRDIAAVESAGIGKADRVEAMAEFDFAHLNIALLPLWNKGLFGAEVTRTELRRRQLSIELDSMMLQRKRASGDAESAEPDGDTRRAHQARALIAYDLADVLLEVAKRRPWLTVLPTPAQFAMNTSGEQIDFVLIDLDAREIVGVRAEADVKTASASRAARGEGSVVLASDADLGNVKPVASDLTAAKQKTVPFPGLIAAHRLAALGNKSQNFQTFARRDLLIELRRVARNLVRETESPLDKATQAVEELILSRFSREAARSA